MAQALAPHRIRIEDWIMKLLFRRGPVDRLESLHPAYFALVMATGIVGIAAQLHGLSLVSLVLFWLNGLFLAVLIIALVLRIARFPRAVAADICSHSRGVGFFTMVAAFGVFGGQLITQLKAVTAAIVFLAITGTLWLVVTYGVFAALVVKEPKPSLADSINGGWLVSVVAAQSVSALTVLVLSNGALASLAQPFMYLALVFWLGGGALYLWLITLIFFRYMFLPMEPDDLAPPYWINMGAVAISTLAGAMLAQNAALSPTLVDTLPFIKGFTVFFWAIGTGWIPMLLVLGVWRYLIREVPFTYDPLYWGFVFPLGMYSVCTHELSELLGAPFLMPLSYGFMVIGLVAWTAALIGLADSLVYRMKHARLGRLGVHDEPSS